MQVFVYVEVWQSKDERGGVRVGGNAFSRLQEVERDPAELVGGQRQPGWGCRSNLLSAKTNTYFCPSLLFCSHGWRYASCCVH